MAELMGVCSRREADRLIEAGKVLVDNRPASMGQSNTRTEGGLQLEGWSG
ncbi:MAG: S4 domain-containing protein [Enterocloster clostridioformis]